MDITRLLLDFGLVILIWMVQLIVYPSFAYYSETDLKSWHAIYTARLSLIVIPLMLSQLIVAALQLWLFQNFYTIGSMIIIILLWFLTFMIFVPLHVKITKDQGNKKIAEHLVNKNRWRTFLWSILFLWSLNEWIFKD